MMPTYNLIRKMEDKAQVKMGVHQLLIKNGFYRLPMHTLTQILKLLEMPSSVEPKSIQQNAINGLIKVVQKYNNKYKDFLSQSKSNQILPETKEYVKVLLEETYNTLSKSSTGPNPPQGPPAPSHSSHMPFYPPPVHSYPPYMMPPMMPMNPNEPPPDQEQAAKMYQEQMKMYQQMYMQQYQYYMRMYSGYPPPNHMYGAPGFGGPPGAPGSAPGKGEGAGEAGKGPGGPVPMGMPPNAPPGGMGAPGSDPMMMGMPPPPPSGMHGMPGMPNMSGMSGMPPGMGGMPPGMGGMPMGMPPGYGGYPHPEPPKKAKESKSVPKAPTPRKADSGQTDATPRFNSKPNLPAQTPARRGRPPSTRDPDSKRATKQSMGKDGYKFKNELLRFCACRGFQRYDEYFLCTICNRTYHHRCLNEPLRKWETKQSIECYHCRMRFIDPLNRVKEVIQECFITNISDSKFTIECNLRPFEYLCRQKQGKNEIEMRCLKVCPHDNSEVTWPDECVIKLNGDRIIEIPALQVNSSLKKRKDYSILITQNIYNKVMETNPSIIEKVRISLEIKPLSRDDLIHKKIKNNYNFAFAIYFVEKLTVDELTHRVITEERVTMPENYYQMLMKTNEHQIQIDKITVSLYDPYTWDLINIPARGNKCTHGQCFDLKTFISFMYTARNRSWKCPICGKDARKFMIDDEQKNVLRRVIDSNNIPSQVSFMKDGNIMLKTEPKKDDKDEEGQDSTPLNKTKQIHKDKKNRGEKDDSHSEEHQANEARLNEPKPNKEDFCPPPEAVVEINDDSEELPPVQPQDTQKSDEKKAEERAQEVVGVPTLPPSQP